MLVKQEIARIKLNPGQGGYFDPITRIHLTHGDPIKVVYAGMNTTGLKAAVRSKRISIISGSLGDFSPPFRLIKGKDGKVKFEWVKKGDKKAPAKKTSKAHKEVTNVEPQPDNNSSDTGVGYAFPWVKSENKVEPDKPEKPEAQSQTTEIQVEEKVEEVAETPSWDNSQLEPAEVYQEPESMITDTAQVSDQPEEDTNKDHNNKNKKKKGKK